MITDPARFVVLYIDLRYRTLRDEADFYRSLVAELARLPAGTASHPERVDLRQSQRSYKRNLFIKLLILTVHQCAGLSSATRRNMESS